MKTDPLPDIIAEILQMEGMHPDTRRLIELAIEAQRTGTLPEFPVVGYFEINRTM